MNVDCDEILSTNTKSYSCSPNTALYKESEEEKENVADVSNVADFKATNFSGSIKKLSSTKNRRSQPLCKVQTQKKGEFGRLRYKFCLEYPYF